MAACITDSDCAANYSNAFCCDEDWCLEDESNLTVVCFCKPNWVGDQCDTVLYWVYGVCGSIIVCYLTVASAVLLRRKRLGLGAEGKGAGPVGSSATWTSSWVGARVLAAFRAAALLACAVVQMNQFVVKGARPLLAYTVWNFNLCTLYFALAFVDSARNLRRGALVGGGHGGGGSMDTLQHIMTAVLEVELPSALLVDLVTWGVLLPATMASGNGDVLLNPTSFVQHGANAVLLLIDFSLSGMRFRRWHVLLCCGWPCCYGVFHIIYTATGNWPIYFFLNMSSPFTFVWFLGLLGIHAAFFYLCVCASGCKRGAPEGEAARSGEEPGEVALVGKTGTKLRAHLSATQSLPVDVPIDQTKV